MKEIYISTHQTVVEWFRSQQKKYIQTSAIIHQLYYFGHCQMWLEMMELALFSYALFPFQLNNQMKRHINSATECMDTYITPSEAEECFEVAITSYRDICNQYGSGLHLLSFHNKFIENSKYALTRIQEQSNRRPIRMKARKGKKDSASITTAWSQTFQMLLHTLMDIKHSLTSPLLLEPMIEHIHVLINTQTLMYMCGETFVMLDRVSHPTFWQSLLSKWRQCVQHGIMCELTDLLKAEEVTVDSLQPLLIRVYEDMAALIEFNLVADMSKSNVGQMIPIPVEKDLVKLRADETLKTINAAIQERYDAILPWIKRGLEAAHKTIRLIQLSRKYCPTSGMFLLLSEFAKLQHEEQSYASHCACNCLKALVAECEDRTARCKLLLKCTISNKWNVQEVDEDDVDEDDVDEDGWEDIDDEDDSEEDEDDDSEEHNVDYKQEAKKLMPIVERRYEVAKRHSADAALWLQDILFDPPSSELLDRVMNEPQDNNDMFYLLCHYRNDDFSPDLLEEEFILQMKIKRLRQLNKTFEALFDSNSTSTYGGPAYALQTSLLEAIAERLFDGECEFEYDNFEEGYFHYVFADIHYVFLYSVIYDACDENNSHYKYKQRLYYHYRLFFQWKQSRNRDLCNTITKSEDYLYLIPDEKDRSGAEYGVSTENVWVANEHDCNFCINCLLHVPFENIGKIVFKPGDSIFASQLLELEDKLMDQAVLNERLFLWSTDNKYANREQYYYGYKELKEQVSNQLNTVLLSTTSIPFAALRKALKVIRVYLLLPNSPIPNDSVDVNVTTNLEWLESTVAWVHLLLEVCIFKIEALNLYRVNKSRGVDKSILAELYDKLVWIEEKGLDSANLMKYFQLSCDGDKMQYDTVAARAFKWLQSPTQFASKESEGRSVEDGKKLMREVVQCWTVEYQRACKIEVSDNVRDSNKVVSNEWMNLF